MTNKYEKAFQDWKHYNFNPQDIPDDVDDAGRVFSEMDENYKLVLEGLEKAEKWDKYTLNGQNITPEIIESIEEAEKKLEAAKTHIEDRLDFLKDATDYECETLKIEIRKVLKILEE